MALVHRPRPLHHDARLPVSSIKTRHFFEQQRTQRAQSFCLSLRLASPVSRLLIFPPGLLNPDS
jgi:hypothetical protein